MNAQTESHSEILSIESLDIEAQGIAHRSDGKVVFVEGALPFERVRVQVQRKKENWERAILSELVQESSQRVQAPCPHFGLHREACGGCKMQHLEPAAQVAIKARVLEDSLWHVGKVRAQTVLPAIHGPSLGYRFRARLSVRYVRKKQEVLIGFHERKSRYIADMRSCVVLPAAVSGLLLPLRALIASMDACETCPQIELAAGDATLALVLRHLEPLSDADLQRLKDFSQAYKHLGLQWWLQFKGPDSMRRLDEGDGSPELCYVLPEFGVRMPFVPADFTQVNPAINRVLVGRVLRLLQVQKDERVIDWFCGLGNFTLPLATRAREVLGVEGSMTLVERAKANLQKNPKATAQTDFVCRDLFGMTAQALLADGHADKWVIDPPRDGAFALCKALAQLQQEPQLRQEQTPVWQAPTRIVYVSCNPASLARDAEVLVHSAGYRLVAAGVVNMFPHTAHVESVAVFDLYPSRAE